MAAHARIVSVLLLLASCSGEVAPTASVVGAPSADVAVQSLGVPDRGDDPAVVVIDIGGDSLCSGVLVASDVVLTARHCVALVATDTQCPAGAPQVVGIRASQSLRILVGDEVASAEERARGRAVLSPPGDVLCGADIALILLDTPIDDIRPMPVRATGAAKGDHLRTVTFARQTGVPPVQKLVRDHLLVVDATATELQVGETCGETSGGPALDESTGEIVGIDSRPAGLTCAGAGPIDRYTRTDAFLPLVAEALATSGLAAAPARGQKKTKKGPIDMGANCGQGDDCAAGVCVADRALEYCSRTCGAHDHCPPHFRCKRTRQGVMACIL